MDDPGTGATNRRTILLPARTDGFSFIEVLVSVVLLGTAVVATMVALRTTVIATATERDHARAHEWLQSASEILVNDVPYEDCDAQAAAAIGAAYQAALRAVPSIVPQDWNISQISVGAPTFALPSALYGAACAADIDRQLVTIEVTDTEGAIVESVDVVVVP